MPTALSLIGSDGLDVVVVVGGVVVLPCRLQSVSDRTSSSATTAIAAAITATSDEGQQHPRPLPNAGCAAHAPVGLVEHGRPVGDERRVDSQVRPEIRKAGA